MTTSGFDTQLAAATASAIGDELATIAAAASSSYYTVTFGPTSSKLWISYTLGGAVKSLQVPLDDDRIRAVFAWLHARDRDVDLQMEPSWSAAAPPLERARRVLALTGAAATAIVMIEGAPCSQRGEPADTAAPAVKLVATAHGRTHEAWIATGEVPVEGWMKVFDARRQIAVELAVALGVPVKDQQDAQTAV